MHEENKLSTELTAQQSEIESAMLGVELPESAIDPNVLMYQAGWSAAMAEFGHSDDRNLEVSKPRLSVWPVVAATFAVSTAVCLILLLRGPGEGAGFDAESNQLAGAETKVEPADESTPVVGSTPKDSEETQADEETRFVRTFRTQSGLASLLRISTDQIMRQRDARIRKLLAETDSRPRRLLTSDNDEDLEPWIPLTPRSSIPFSL